MDVHWHSFESREAFTAAVVEVVRRVIEDAVAARGGATLALSGGKTPVAILERLAALPLPWPSVTVLPSDDRLVPITHPLSNAGMLARVFGGTDARVQPLVSAVVERRAAGRRADVALQRLAWPLDLVWLGMGGDGHTASIFAGPDLEAALAPAPGVRAIGVHPEPLPPEAPVDRVTLTAPAIADARRCVVVIEGEAKRALLERAIADAAASAFPVGRVLARRAGPVEIFHLG